MISKACRAHETQQGQHVCNALIGTEHSRGSMCAKRKEHVNTAGAACVQSIQNACEQSRGSKLATSMGA